MNFAITDAAPSTSEITNEQTTPCDGSLSPRTARTNPVFVVPRDDLQQFAALPDKVREELRRTLKALQTIHRASNKKEACRLQELQFSRTGSPLRGFSAVSLHRKYYAYIECGDWKCLVDRAKAGPEWWNGDATRCLPEAFLQFWKQLCESNQRKCSPARRELLKIWRLRKDTLGNSYKSIPGYDVWPECGPCGDHPKGWSLENLMRHAPDDFERAAARVGRLAASEHRRKVFTSRVGCSVLQVIFFDDQVYDNKVNFMGGSQQRAIRPRGFNALDYFSACFFQHCFKPEIITETGKETLKTKTDFVAFLASVLTTTGYNDQTGTHLVVEHGSASISEDLERRIYDLTQGKVVVDRSGFYGDPALAAQFEGQSRGNFRFKASLESLFNLVRNDMAMIPGQTGLDRDHSPDDLVGRDSYNEALRKVAVRLSPDCARLLRMPFMEWNEWVALTMDIYLAINKRTDHKLEGWKKAGLFRKEWRLPVGQEWLPLLAFENLLPQQQHALLPIIHTRTRALSPQEVFNQGADSAVRLPMCAMFDLLGPAFPLEERSVRNGYITIEDQAVDSEPMRFPAYPIGNGEKFRTYLADKDTLLLADARNRFVTTLTRQNVPCRLDYDAVQKEIALSRKEENARLSQMGIRHTDRAKQKAAAHKHNADLMRSADPIARVKPTTQEDRDLDKLFKAAIAENSPPQPEQEIEPNP